MSHRKARAEDHPNFLIATPTATEAVRVLPIRPEPKAHDSFTRLLITWNRNVPFCGRKPNPRSVPLPNAVFGCGVSFSTAGTAAVVMSWLGHRDSAMVKHYYHLPDQEAQRQMRRVTFTENRDGVLPSVR